MCIRQDEDSYAQLRAFGADLSGLIRAVEFRDVEAGLTCIAGFGSSVWDKLFGATRPAELHPFLEISSGGRHAVSTPGDILFHIRELAPISDAAWVEIEEETTRTLKRHLAVRRVVDVPSPGGITLSGVGTERLKTISAPADCEVKPLVELRVPFELSRQAVDDVERGLTPNGNPRRTPPGSWPLRKMGPSSTATRKPICRVSARAPAIPSRRCPPDVRAYPDAVAHALSQLRLVGVNGPFSVLLGAEEYTALAETRDHGYPVLEHVKRIVDGNLIWAPAIEGAFVVTTRGGDFELNIGQDVSIDYLSHTDSAVQLYLQEAFAFRVLASEAAIALSPSAKAS